MYIQHYHCQSHLVADKSGWVVELLIDGKLRAGQLGPHDLWFR